MTFATIQFLLAQLAEHEVLMVSCLVGITSGVRTSISASVLALSNIYINTLLLNQSALFGEARQGCFLHEGFTEIVQRTRFQTKLWFSRQLKGKNTRFLYYFPKSQGPLI